MNERIPAVARIAREQPQDQRRKKVRHDHQKPFLAWEQADKSSKGLYGQYLSEIVEHYPTLTSMEARVAALVKSLLPSWRIAELLGISERTVENHRTSIRRKTGCHDTRLSMHLFRSPNMT
jgi:DNA-binding CsgD family transcriptional regulator